MSLRGAWRRRNLNYYSKKYIYTGDRFVVALLAKTRVLVRMDLCNGCNMIDYLCKKWYNTLS